MVSAIKSFGTVSIDKEITDGFLLKMCDTPRNCSMSEYKIYSVC